MVVRTPISGAATCAPTLRDPSVSDGEPAYFANRASKLARPPPWNTSHARMTT
jgi:hypothetical protein